MIRFGIVGAGWRTEFFLRIAAACESRFEVGGLLSRTSEKAEALGTRYNVPIASSLEDLLARKLDFVVVSVLWGVAPEITLDLARRGMPVLCETPPAPGEGELFALHDAISRLPQAKIQVAEQYFLQPLHATRLEIIRRDWIGTPSFAHVSAAHGYHGLSLLRRYLGIGYEMPTISARGFTSPLTKGPDRNGPPPDEAVRDSQQLLAYLEWDNALGAFDFCGDHYYSWIRSPHVLVRGERGEIHNETVRYLQDFQTPMVNDLRREAAGIGGNLEGHYLKGYTVGGEWLYRNIYAPARLLDDEIAIAGCLDGMTRYVDTGEPIYSLADAMHDRYLDIWMERAKQSGEALKPSQPPWAISP